MGLRKKGKEHIDIFGKVQGVRIVTLCDVDTQFLNFEAKKFKNRNEKVTTYVDYRKLLDDKDIDAVVIVTPDHWHALMMVWACQAGKDVYVEKPTSHNIWEGRKMVQAARKYKRIVQVGSQDRSDVGLQAAVAYIKQGNLGSIKLVRAISCNLVYLAMAIGGGSLVGDWMNNNGFWIFARMGGLTEIETLKSWTILTAALGLITLAFTLLFASILPLV